MKRDVRAYFAETIIPLIARRHPEVAPETCILVRGSFGLGIADEHSDLDAIIYLDDTLWRSHGGHLQLTLLHEAPEFAGIPTGHPEICVWPLSWLLGGHHRAFLDSEADAPWEKVSIEHLYELQANLVPRDAHEVFRRLRAATAPARFPEWLWRKRAVEAFRKLDEDLFEARQVVARGRTLEAQISLGRLLETLLRLGFLVNRAYHPWWTHLRWAFERLPAPAPTLLPHLDRIASSPDWDERLASAATARETYRQDAIRKGMLTPEIFEDLEWAARCKAWSDPNWRDRITRCRRLAEDAGYDPAEGWVWSLWRWVDADTA